MERHIGGFAGDPDLQQNDHQTVEGHQTGEDGLIIGKPRLQMQREGGFHQRVQERYRHGGNGNGHQQLMPLDPAGQAEGGGFADSQGIGISGSRRCFHRGLQSFRHLPPDQKCVYRSSHRTGEEHKLHVPVIQQQAEKRSGGGA
ncbi:hypothetical protein D3C76_1424030 [compost metagenome]